MFLQRNKQRQRKNLDHLVGVEAACIGAWTAGDQEEIWDYEWYSCVL